VKDIAQLTFAIAATIGMTVFLFVISNALVVSAVQQRRIADALDRAYPKPVAAESGK